MTAIGISRTTSLARTALFSFLAVFIASRTVVILIMTRTLPDLFLHVGRTHIHHLNYGIFLLSGLAAYLLFSPPAHVLRRKAAIWYGAAMALTYDEFGIWLHLGGSYWQRASWDAVGTVAALLALFAFGPAIAQLRPRRSLATAGMTAVTALFLALLWWSLPLVHNRLEPRLRSIESTAPQ